MKRRARILILGLAVLLTGVGCDSPAQTAQKTRRSSQTVKRKPAVRQKKEKKRMDTSPVEVGLSVTASGPQVTAKLAFTNRTTHPVHVWKFNGCLNGEVENNVFQITTAGRELDYIGRYVKRGVPGPDEFVRLAPGQTIRAEVRLDTVYEFPPGAHIYQIVYEADHGYPPNPDDFTLESASVRFSATK